MQKQMYYSQVQTDKFVWIHSADFSDQVTGLSPAGASLQWTFQ